MFALCADGCVLLWAEGDGAPSPLPGLSGDVKVAQISCGAAHCLACTEGGALWAWGRGDEGQV